MSAPVLEFKQVRASWGGPPVLHDIDWVVEPGQRWAVIGPNGAGKSSLVRVAMGLLAPSAGEVRLSGEPLPLRHRAALAQKVGWVPQAMAEGTGFTALEVVLMGLSSRQGPFGLATAAQVERARALLATQGLAAFEARNVDTLSGGERRLVWLMRALLQAPSLLLLDEPTAFLDVRHQSAGLSQVKQAVGAGAGIRAAVAVLHDLNLAASFATHALLLSRGRVVAQGEASAVLTAQALSRLFEVEVVQAATEGGPVFAVRSSS